MNLVDRIVDYYKKQNYPISEKIGEINICYLEGCNSHGELNDDRLNVFNDRRLVFGINTNNNVIFGNWDATTEPSRYYTNNPLNPKGAARIKFGYYTAWKVGIHGNSEPHEALVQVAPITVHRDLNKDGIRTGDKIDVGNFGINQHWGYNLPLNDVGKASAGCLVGRSRFEHRLFMQLVKSDSRYRNSREFLFGTAIIDASKL
jgi:hypothetical protein